MNNSAVKFIALISVLSIVFGTMYGCSKNKARRDSTTTVPSTKATDFQDSTESTTKSETTKITETIKTVRTTKNIEVQKKDEIKVKGWVNACKAYLEKYITGPDYTGEELFSLHYINSDDIPELVISAGTASYQSASIYVFREGIDNQSDRYMRVPGAFGTCGVFYYKEKSGIIVDEWAKMAYRYAKVYHIDGTYAEEVLNSEAVYPEFDNHYDPEMYMISDRPVSREEYEKQYNNFVPKNLCAVSSAEFNSAEKYGDGYAFAKDIKYHEVTPSYSLTTDNITKYVK